MAINVTQPKVQTPSSQASSISPVVVKEQPGLMDQLLANAPQFAQAIITAQQVAQKNQMSAQAAEDSATLGELSAEINNLALGALKAEESRSNLQNLSIELAQGYNDGNIGADDYKTLNNFNNEFESFQNMIQQKPTTARQVEVRAREKLASLSARNPHLTNKLEQTFRAAMGGVSISSGAQAQQSLQNVRAVQAIYGANPTPDQFKRYGRLEAQRRQYEAMKEDLALQAESGQLHFTSVKNLIGGKFDNGIQRVNERALALLQQQGALTEDQRTELKSAIRGVYNSAINSSRGLVNEANATGTTLIGRDDVNTFLNNDLGVQVQTLEKWIDEGSLEKKLTAMNEASKAIADVGAMNKVRNVQTILGENNTGGAIGLSMLLQGKDPTTRQAIEGLIQQSNGSLAGDAESLMVDAFAFVNQQTIPVGFEKIATLAGITSIRNGDTDPTVQSNTAVGLADMNERKGDISQTVAHFLDPAMARTYANADDNVVVDLKNSVTQMNAQTLNRIRQEDMLVEYDSESDRFVVFEQPHKKIKRISRRRNAKVVDGRITNEDFQVSDVFETKKRSRMSRVSPNTPVSPLVDTALTKDLNALYRLHKNPSYRKLGGGPQFVKDWQELDLGYQPPGTELMPDEQLQ